MNDFRKKMHVAYKKRLANIIMQFMASLYDEKKLEEFQEDPENIVAKWLDSNMLPMGDFSKEDAIKEMEEWQQ